MTTINEYEMKQWRRNVIIILAFLLPFSAFAATISNLYQTDISVASKGSEVRRHVLPQALQQVLIKVSGNSALASLPSIQQQLKLASTLVQQYQYVTQHQGEADQRLVLRVRFAKAGVNKLLHAAGQGVWGSERPLIAVWLVSENNTLVTADEDALLAQQLQLAATKRGVALVLPLGDIEDLQQVSVNDVEEENWPALQQASLRYGADAVVIGKMSYTTDSRVLQAQWIAQLQDEKMTWQQQGSDTGQLLKEGVDTIADSLAARYAVLPPTAQQRDAILLTVTGINSGLDYSRLNQYLHDLDILSDVQVTRTVGDEVDYQLTLETSIATLIQTLNNQHRLAPQAGEEQTQAHHFYYRYSS